MNGRGGGTQLFLVGGAVGAAMTAGHAALLYTGAGFLRTAGFLLAVTLVSLAAGLWAGVRASPRARRSWTLGAFALAAIFIAVWTVNQWVRATAFGGALAVLLVLAEPAYTSGSLLSALSARPGAPAALAFAGAGVGVAIAAAVLIPRFDASSVYLGAATTVFLAGFFTTPAAAGQGEQTMNGKAVLITGVGSRGQLGFVLAERFLRAGARVAITGRTAEVETFARELEAQGEIIAVVADLLSDDDVNRLVSTMRERFGRLDALINAAGGLSVTGTIEDTSPEAWTAEIRRNAETALRLSRAALPLLRESRGAIVNFASPAGQRAVKALGAYSAAKASVIALTRSLALEERARGVRVNALAPGMMDTEQNREAGATRFVRREEVAEVALFLASDAASGISGEVIGVAGETLG